MTQACGGLFAGKYAGPRCRKTGLRRGGRGFFWFFREKGGRVRRMSNKKQARTCRKYIFKL